MHPAWSALGSIPQHVAREAQDPVGVPPLLLLPELLPELLPLLLELDTWHSLEQFDISQESMASPALMQLASFAFAAQAEDIAAVALNVPPGHSQLRRSLQPLSTALTCELHLLSTHDEHAEVEFCAAAESMQELPVPPPLLLEHANAATVAKIIPPATNAAFIIATDLPGSVPARWTREHVPF